MIVSPPPAATVSLASTSIAVLPVPAATAKGHQGVSEIDCLGQRDAARDDDEGQGKSQGPCWRETSPDPSRQMPRLIATQLMPPSFMAALAAHSRALNISQAIHRVPQPKWAYVPTEQLVQAHASPPIGCRRGTKQGRMEELGGSN